MPIGSSSRPQEPLYVIRMALALALTALAGGALGLVWNWFAGENLPEDQIEAASQPPADSEEEEEEEEEEESPPPTPSPQPAPTPRPSPNPG